MKPRAAVVRALALGCFLSALAIAGHLAWTFESLFGCGKNAGCLEMLQGRWSLFLGVPVSLFGVLTYGSLVVTGLIAIRSRVMSPAVRNAEAAGSVLAIGAAAWFVAVEAFLAREFCPWCSAAHALAVAGVVLGRAARSFGGGRVGPAPSAWSVGLPVAAVAALAIVQTLGPEPERVRSARVSGLLATSPDGDRRLRLYDGEIVLDPDALPVIGDPSTVTGLVLTDWTCPHCLELHRTLERIAGEAPSGFGVVVAPAFRTAEAKEIHRIMLSIWRTDRDLYLGLAGEILSGELEPAAAAVSARARESAAGGNRDLWVEETLRTSERLLSMNDARLSVASLPQLMIGDQILVGVPRRETILGLASASAGLAAHASAGRSPPRPAPSSPISPSDDALREAGGGLTFAGRHLDLGQVVKGDVASGRFEFRNAGSEPISITRITSACACSTVQGWRQTVEPGASGSFGVRLDTSRLKGRVSKAIDVETSASRVATRLYVDADVWSPVKVTPSSVSFGSGKRGAKPRPKRLQVEVTDANPLPISEVSTTNPHFRAEIRTLEPGRRYEVVVDVPEGIQGTQEGELVIALRHPRIAEERLSLSVDELSAVRVYPKEILGSATPNPRPIRTVITVHVDDPRVPKLEIRDPRFVGAADVRLEMEEGAEARSRRIVLEFPAGFDAAAAEAAGAHLSFSTNHPDFPVLRVPVRVPEIRRR